MRAVEKVCLLHVLNSPLAVKVVFNDVPNAVENKARVFFVFVVPTTELTVRNHLNVRCVVHLNWYRLCVRILLEVPSLVGVRKY